MPTYTFSLNGGTLKNTSDVTVTTDISVTGTITSSSNTVATATITGISSSILGTSNGLLNAFDIFVYNSINFSSTSFDGTSTPISFSGQYSNFPPSVLSINHSGFVFKLVNGIESEFNGSANAYITAGKISIIGEGSGGGGGGGGDGLVCFVEGTRLLTQNGYKAIETLTSGDLLETTENRSIPFQLSRIQVACTTKATAPYLLATGSLGENIPSVPLYMSPAHKFAVRDNIWVHASKGHTLGLDIKQCPVGKAVTYYHVRCDNYARDVILAEGVATESLANKTEDSITFKKTDKVGVFLRNEYKAPTKSLKA